MRPLKYLLFILIAVMVLYGCDDPEGNLPDRTVNPIPSADISGQFLVNKTSIFVTARQVDIEFATSMDGKGYLGRLGPSNINLHHNEIITMSGNKVMIKTGRLKLRTDDGDEIYGYYDNISTGPNDNRNINVSIRGGKGNYKEAHGTIFIELVAKGQTEYLALVKGTLHFPKEPKSPVI